MTRRTKSRLPIQEFENEGGNVGDTQQRPHTRPNDPETQGAVRSYDQWDDQRLREEAARCDIVNYEDMTREQLQRVLEDRDAQRGFDQEACDKDKGAV